MKSYLTLGLVAGLAILTRSHAQTWQTSDNFRVADNLGASAGDIATDFSGSLLYTVGSTIMPDGTSRALVRASGDSGQTWTTLDSYLGAGSQKAHFRGVASGASGTASGWLFVAGWEGNPPGNLLWVVRRSSDQGFTWETVDSPPLNQLGSCPSAGDIRVAPSGEIYAAGTQGGGSAPFKWVVRSSTREGDAGTWATADLLGTAGVSEARSIAFNGEGAVFVSGHVANSSGQPVWTVRRSLDRGATWTTVDSYSEGNNLPSGSEGIAVSSSGAIYAVGFARGVVKRKTLDYWVVRRSTNGGTAWSTVDKSNSADGSYLSPTAITLDAGGNVWVAGFVGPSASPKEWIVRKGVSGSAGTIAWTVSDAFSTGNGARANGITIDALGNIFATGRSADAVENWWLTRKLSAP